MKTLRRLILANAAVLFAVGIGIGFNPPLRLPVTYAVGEPYQSLAQVHLLAMALAGLALVVLLQSRLSLTGDLRQLALALGVADALIALMAFLEQIAFGGSPAGWLLIAGPLAPAALLVWLARRPLRPAETAAEIASLRIPAEIRQGLLQQIGEAAAQEERNRLARDLHDSIKQQLFSINVGTAAAQERWVRDPEGARQALADVRRSAREAMVEMQAMLHQLRPEALGTAGLVEALREQCEALGFRTGAEVTLEIGEPLPDDRMPPGAQDTLFRIGQEMLANVARHARARHVQLWLGRLGEEVVLRVTDDGQGFDPAAKASGMGLRHLKERATSLRGRLEVVSLPGAGATVQVWVPLLPVAPDGGTSSLKERSLSLNANVFLYFCLVVMMAPDDLYPTVHHHLGDLRFLIVFLMANLLVWIYAATSWWEVHDSPRKSPEATPAELQSYRYEAHRGRALMFLLGVWHSYRNVDAPGGWGIVSRLLGLLFLALMVLDLYGAHRWSRPSRRPFADWAWPRRPRATALLWLGLLMAVLLVANMALNHEFWTQPAQLTFAALAAALLAYFLWRRPLTEGAPDES